MGIRRGLSVLELIVVIAIVASLASVALPIFTDVHSTAKESSTRSTLVQVRDAVTLYWADTKSIPLDGLATFAIETQRFQVVWLFRNPVTNLISASYDPLTRIGWNGPYLLHATGDPDLYGQHSLIDAWNNPVVIQDFDSNASIRDVRVVSAGPNGVIDIPAAVSTTALTSSEIGDDIYVAFYLH